MPRILAIFSDRADDLEFATAAAGKAGCELKHDPSLAPEALTAALGDANTAVLIDVNSPERLRLLESAVSGAAKARIHAIAAPQDKAFLASVFESKALGHIIPRRYLKPAADGEFYGEIVAATDLSEPFGLQCFLGKEAQIDSLHIDESLEKGFVANALTYQLAQLKFNELIIPAVTNAVDELLMNAVYDAPTDEKGQQLYARESRNTNIKLSGKSRVEMQLGARGDQFGVTVIDHFGSMDPAVILRSIAKSFNGKQEESRNPELAGAGLGLSMILKSGGSLHFVCKPGERTEASVFFKRTDRQRDFNKQFQFVAARLV